MSLWTRRPTSPLNPEFARAVPTNGFGEIEATALASLSSFAPPRPHSVTPKTARKVCRIFSPISSARSRDGSLSISQSQHTRPHTADVPYRPRIEVSTGKQSNGNICNSNSVDSGNNHPVGCRPVTSDSSTERRASQLHNQLQGVNATGERAGVDGVGRRGELRPSTSCRGTRPRGGLDSCNSPGGADVVSSRGWVVSKDQREWRCGVDQQAGHRVQDNTRQRPANPVTSPNLDGGANSFDQRNQRREVETPPNRYWPSAGPPKDFLRPFIERNRARLWAYDPALVGMDHVQAYRHIVGMGNIHGVKRMLLEKEDALVRGTGSLLMADTIHRQRGVTTSSASTIEPGRRPWLHRTPPRPSTAIEQDQFQCGGHNSDKVRREEARRRELASHAATRSNVFCRRKGYEPGDFLKVTNSAPIAGGSDGGRKRVRRRVIAGEPVRLSSRRVGAGGSRRVVSPGRNYALS